MFTVKLRPGAKPDPFDIARVTAAVDICPLRHPRYSARGVRRKTLSLRDSTGSLQSAVAKPEQRTTYQDGHTLARARRFWH